MKDERQMAGCSPAVLAGIAVVVLLLALAGGTLWLAHGRQSTPQVLEVTRLVVVTRVLKVTAEGQTTPAPEQTVTLPERITVITLKPSPTVTATRVPTVTPEPPPASAGSIISVTTRTRETDGMVQVYVPAGSFLMGSDAGDPFFPDFADEQPVHPVTLDAFWLDRTEVTWGQYAACVAGGDCDRPAADCTSPGDEYPVACVTWQQARDFCAWAGGRLPTEAEWEYAARGPAGRVYPWGDEWDMALANVASPRDPYNGPAPVGSFPAGESWIGALDMAGNVWEWVADWYGSYPEGAVVNPAGTTGGSARVLRGGSWANETGRTARSAHRVGYAPDTTLDVIGFRCANPDRPTVVTQTRPADEMVQVYVPAGTFLMGSVAADASGSPDERPAHPVTLAAFWLDRTEVTWGQYGACVAGGACQPAYCDGPNDEHPVFCVDWYRAEAYCLWAGGRLPTEAEWEYAARGPQGHAYPWSEEWDCTRANGLGCDPFDRTAPVGSFPAGASWVGARIWRGTSGSGWRTGMAAIPRGQW